MEQLTAKQQQEINKMSTERLRMNLAKLDFDEEEVAALDRATLIATFANYLLKPLPQLKPRGSSKRCE